MTASAPADRPPHSAEYFATVVTPPPPAEIDAADALAARLADELSASWRKGECRPVEDFLAGYPELRDHPRAALRLVYEEVCLRQELGQNAAVDEVLARFPQWATQLRVLLECHQLFEPAPQGPAFPQVGQNLGGFRLLAELGRGAQGRVFLATQPALADRPVVLKITPCTGGEHLSLARLQHTGIVPLYLVEDNKDCDQRILCMPYFGGLTLAQLLDELKATPLVQRTGEQIVQALDRAQANAPVTLPAKGAFRQGLARLSFDRALCWIAACLADALQHAHEHGLMHLDVKPSNVLLATDGQPMLLDFHLAQPPIHPNRSVPDWVGGTIAYMPREQQAAMSAVNTGQPIAAGVDGRADVYSLGALLYEALGGRVPYLPGVSPPLHRINPQVSVGLSDIVAKSLAYYPSDRYATAADLAADLRRHLNDLPLRGVANRSWPERWQKWRRRKPHGLRWIGAAIIVLVALGMAGFLYRHNVVRNQMEAEEKLRRSRLALENGNKWLRVGYYSRARDSFARGLGLIDDMADVEELGQELTSQFRLAKRFEAGRQLRLRSNDIRYLFGPESLSYPAKRQLEADCAAIWGTRRNFLDRSGAELPADAEKEVHTDLLDMAIIWSDLHVRLAAGAAEVRPACREALKVLDEAEKLFGRSAALERERQAVAEKLGDRELARSCARRLAHLKPRTAWGYCLLGRSLIRARQWRPAHAALQKAVDLDPHGFWPHFYQGVCAYESVRNSETVGAPEKRRYQEAVSAFGVCIALEKNRPALCYFNRALAHVRLKQADRALHDFEAALSGGADPVTVHYQLAVLHFEQRHNRKAALASLDRLLTINPGDRLALKLQERLK